MRRDPLRAGTLRLTLAANIMRDYNYPECTTSVITSLALFRKSFPKYRRQEIEYAVQLGDVRVV